MNLEHVHPAPKSGLGRCPYCHEGIDSQEVGLWSCPGCGAHHHLECLEDFGHCAVYGCASAAPFARALTPSQYEALKAQRRARYFATRHQSRAPNLDPDLVSLAQRITVEPVHRGLWAIWARTLAPFFVAGVFAIVPFAYLLLVLLELL